jgi:6-pyruvoyl-tetrahydropterin synthase
MDGMLIDFRDLKSFSRQLIQEFKSLTLVPKNKKGITLKKTESHLDIMYLNI